MRRIGPLAVPVGATMCQHRRGATAAIDVVRPERPFQEEAEYSAHGLVMLTSRNRFQGVIGALVCSGSSDDDRDVFGPQSSNPGTTVGRVSLRVGQVNKLHGFSTPLGLR